MFYPGDLDRSAFFARYAEHFDTVEINNTFYNLPEPETFEAWRTQAAEGFEYAVKMSRYGTHMKKLKDPENWIGTFLERADILGERLGPVLLQLPPKWNPDIDRLEAALRAAPADHRWALEVRDPAWFRDDIYECLRRHGCALVIHDLIDDHPRVATAPFVYIRMHGPDPHTPYTGGYDARTLRGLSQRVSNHAGDGRDVYVYFNNDAEGDAPFDALKLKEYAGIA